MVKMEKQKREKKVLNTPPVEKKEETKPTTLNKNVEKAITGLTKELKKIGYANYLKTPQCPDGLFRRILKPVLVDELEKERL